MNISDDLEELKYRDEIPASNRLVRFFWALVYKIAFRTTPRWAMHEWRSILLRLFGATIGTGCKISPSARIFLPSNLTIGNYVALGDEVDCYCMDKIVIRSFVAISARSFLCTGSHDICSLNRPLITKPIFIEQHVWICSQAFIGPGVNVGEGSIVGACAVVVRDVPKWSVVVGNPARIAKPRTLRP